MDPVSPIPAIAAIALSFLTSFLLSKKFGAPSEQGRFSSIDGLRGYLAFCVFLHHSSIWYFYLRLGQWKVPPSNLYTHFGQSSVAFFFMITGFLFFSKIIEGRKKDIDWTRLYVSRVLRLVPLYLIVMSALLVIVAYLSNGLLTEPITTIMKELVRWFSFTILGSPDINGIARTVTIVAGVTWSLPYEWFFYLSLPLLALTVRAIPPYPYIALGIVGVVGLILWAPASQHLLSFLGGILASILVRYRPFQEFAVKRSLSLAIIFCVATSVALFPSAYGLVPLGLLSIAFTLIACGNSLFGILTNPVSRMLGEMAYGIYLIHGITLFVVFSFVIGIPESRALSVVTHWLVVLGVTPILITICFLSFRFVESPAMQSTTRVTAWLQSSLARLFASIRQTSRV